MVLKDDLMEVCILCKNKFAIMDGFLGTPKDYKRFITNKIPLAEEFECGYHTSLVSICNVCISKANKLK